MGEGGCSFGVARGKGKRHEGLSLRDRKKHLCILCCIYADVSLWLCVYVGDNKCLRTSVSSLEVH